MRAVPAACGWNGGRCDRRSAIYRELGRNRKADGSYLPETAQRFAWARRLRGSTLERRRQLGDAGMRDLRRSMGERNLALIRARFSMARVVDAYAVGTQE